MRVGATVLPVVLQCDINPPCPSDCSTEIIINEETDCPECKCQNTTVPPLVLLCATNPPCPADCSTEIIINEQTGCPDCKCQGTIVRLYLLVITHAFCKDKCKIEIRVSDYRSCAARRCQPMNPTTGGIDIRDCDYSHFGSNHTMNLPPNEECGAIHKSGVSEDELQIILQKHNEFRAKVANGMETQGSPGPQPSATNMKELRWNTQLAEVAQVWNFASSAHHVGRDSKSSKCETFFVLQNT
ncbi:unnamed protein product, partial [Meganyctiphanes norvegica]